MYFGLSPDVTCVRPSSLVLQAAREEDLLFSQNLTESVASQAESETEAESVDLDVQSDASGNTTVSTTFPFPSSDSA